MNGIPEKELEETRAALAPTLEATAAILPWLTKPREPRFDEKLNQRWIDACLHLSKAWTGRHGEHNTVRSAIFALYGIALDTADGECLRLGEALASAADQLEGDTLSPRLIAALTATIECLNDREGLEHKVFSERARHFADRLSAACLLRPEAGDRSAVLDHLFAEEARERIALMHDALAALPPDAYALKCEAAQIAQQAEYLELYGIVHQARALAERIANEPDLDSDATRRGLAESLLQLSGTIAAVDA